MKRRTRKKLRAFAGPALVVVVLAAGFSLAFSAFGGAHAQTEHLTANFVQGATVGNEFEIESSRMALDKSSNADVKKFAQHMVDDHTQASQNLTNAIASTSNVEAPANHMDTKHQALLDKLNASSGKDFDKMYVKDQVAAHDEAVSLFQGYAAHGESVALKDFAAHTLPTLESHQQAIRQINSSI